MHVLVVESAAEHVRALGAVLRASGHRPEVVGSAGAALAALARPAAPDLLLVGDPPPDMATLELLGAVARMGASPPCLLVGGDDGAARWVEATRLGALDYIPRDPGGVWLRTLAARVEAVGRVAARRDRVQHLADALESTAAAVVLAHADGRIEHANASCLRLLGRTGDAALGTLPDLFALEEAPRLREDLLGAVAAGGEWAGEVPVIRADGERVPCLVTLSAVRRAGGGSEGVVLTLRDVSDRVAMEEALRTANRRLADQASRDPLTGLYNRAYFQEVLAREISRTVRYGGEAAVLMVDLDDFKRVNDERGHAAGDAVLAEVARVLGAGLREGDVLARYGGDEFCVLLPATARPAARGVAERLRLSLAERALEASGTRRVRASVGIASTADLPPDGAGAADALVRLADRALLSVKRAGGDRALAVGEEPPGLSGR